MNPSTDLQDQDTRKESYRICSACGILMRRSEPLCPECGARPGSPFPGERSASAESKVFGFLLLFALAGALALLSLNRGPAAERESLRLSRLMPGEPTEPSSPQPSPAAEPDPVSSPFDSEEDFAQPFPPVEAPRTPVPQAGTPETDFQGDDDALAHVPFGEPDPPAADVAGATPAPLSRAEQIQQRRDELIKEYARRLDENHPMFSEGQWITLQLTDGTRHSGVLNQLAGGQVELRLPTGEARWFFSRQLTPETRLRVDPSERRALVQERAWEEALRELQPSP